MSMLMASYQISVVNDTAQATPTNFQQLIQTTLQYPSGTRFWSPTDGWLLAWLESLSSTNQATIWVKIPSSIPPNGTYQLYMTQDSTLGFNVNYLGEAPQLSSSYAQYDNGANVFNFYDNFAGTSLNTTTWSNVGSSGTSGSTSGISVNNGLSLTGGDGGDAGHETWIKTSLASGSFTGPLATDVYENSPSTATCFRWGLTNSIPTTFGGGTDSIGEQIYNDGNWYTDTGNSSGGTQNQIGSWSSLANTYVIWGFEATESVVYYFDPNTHTQLSNPGQTITTTIPTYSSSISLSLTNGYTNPIYVKWVRTRAYPPNGTMPSVSLGTTQYSGELITVSVP